MAAKSDSSCPGGPSSRGMSKGKRKKIQSKKQELKKLELCFVKSKFVLLPLFFVIVALLSALWVLHRGIFLAQSHLFCTPTAIFHLGPSSTQATIDTVKTAFFLQSFSVVCVFLLATMVGLFSRKVRSILSSMPIPY